MHSNGASQKTLPYPRITTQTARRMSPFFGLRRAFGTSWVHKQAFSFKVGAKLETFLFQPTSMATARQILQYFVRRMQTGISSRQAPEYDRLHLVITAIYPFKARSLVSENLERLCRFQFRIACEGAGNSETQAPRFRLSKKLSLRVSRGCCALCSNCLALSLSSASFCRLRSSPTSGGVPRSPQ